MHLYSARTALRYQFIIDSLDVWLPATNLGLVNFNDGILGIAGSVLPLKVARLLDIERIIHAQNCHVPHGHPQTLAIYRWEEIVSYFHCGEIILLFSCCTEHGLIHLFTCKWSVGSCPTRRYLLVHFASECILCERFPWPRGWCYRTRSKLVKKLLNHHIQLEHAVLYLLVFRFTRPSNRYCTPCRTFCKVYPTHSISKSSPA